ncbi:MAG: hypothetical protein GF346_13555 [Candidatus Eisenbacteria bacterium]|nr:hypothetical protein [Candidatus Latescibacterota bacterium]MBD3303466.1 hypothetical protein [Candidatus Eisenbacteria bacterium]
MTPDRTGGGRDDRSGPERGRAECPRNGNGGEAGPKVERAGLAAFLANLSHDMRSPLTSLQEFVSIVHEGLAGPLTETQRDYLTIALRNAETLAEMMNNLLVVTQMQQGTYRLHRRRVRLADLLRREALEIGRKPGGKEVKIAVSVAPRLPDVYADPDRILEAMRNLVENAAKYSGESVAIEIEARAGRRDEVEIHVRDNGFGMDKATRSRLFVRSYRGKGADGRSPGGLGLGLSIVREILERHGGRITVTSGLDVGTTFRLVLPRFDGPKIVRAEVRKAWKRSGGSGGVAAVQLRIGKAAGALKPTCESASEEVRDVLGRSLEPGDALLPDCAPEEAVCFLHHVEKSELPASVRRILRGLEERLLLQTGTTVVWKPAPRWFHSDEFNNPEEMAETILHRWGLLGEERNAT